MSDGPLVDLDICLPVNFTHSHVVRGGKEVGEETSIMKCQVSSGRE